LAGKGTDGALVTCQRVWAALGVGWAPLRTIMTMVPLCSAASASRREAVRSKAGARPSISITTAAAPPCRTESTPARSRLWRSGRRSSTMAAGSMPSSARPGA
jgi:hypothetical protein